MPIVNLNERWEYVSPRQSLPDLRRLKVPGGWLVTIDRSEGSETLAFVPDPGYTWGAPPPAGETGDQP